jgi:hypothetical protein
LPSLFWLVRRDSRSVIRSAYYNAALGFGINERPVSGSRKQTPEFVKGSRK